MSSDDSGTMVPGTDDGETVAAESGARGIEAQVDKIVNVTLLTIMTMMRLIQAKGEEAMGEEERAELEKVRQSVGEAAEALDEWRANEAERDSGIDLSAMQAKVDLLKQKLEEWPAASDSPPS